MRGGSDPPRRDMCGTCPRPARLYNDFSRCLLLQSRRARRDSVIVPRLTVARALQSLAVSVGLFVMSQDGDGESQTDSGGEEERLSEKVLYDLLKTERHGVKLKSDLGKALANYLAEEVKVTDFTAEVMDMTRETWERTLNDSYKKALPAAWLATALVWRGDVLVPDSHGIDKPAADGARNEKTGEKPAETDPDAGQTEPERRVMTSDINKQGLSAPEIKRLALALEIGTLVPLSTCTDAYGTDPRETAPHKSKVKAGIPVLTKIIASRDLAGLQDHFSMLMQAFSKAGATQEVSLLAQFTAFTYEIADKAIMWEYLSCWFSHYRGRGIPETFDVRIYQQIVMRISKRSDVNAGEAKEKAANAAAKASRHEAEIAALRRELKELKNARGGGEKDKNKKDKRTCFICGEAGHLARDCPTKLENNTADNEAPEQ